MHCAVAVAVFVVVVGGAHVGACRVQVPPPANGGTPRVELPDLPANLGVDDDVDLHVPGLQFNVRAVLVDGLVSGCTQIEVRNETTGDQGRRTIDENSEITIVIDFATAPDPGAVNTIVATCVNGEGVAGATAEVIAVEREPVPSARCGIEEPLNGDRVVGDSVEVVVRCTGSGDLSDAQRALLAAGSVLLTSEASAGAPYSAQVQLRSGVGTGTIRFARSGRHEITATLVDSDGVFDPPVESETISVMVALPQSPTCTIIRPFENEVVEASDDLDANPLDGITTVLRGTCPSEGDGTFSVTCTDDTGGRQNLAGALAWAPDGDAFAFEAAMEDLVNPRCVVVVSVAGFGDVSRAFTVLVDDPTIDVVIDPDADDDGFYERDDDGDRSSAATVEVDVSIMPFLPSGSWTGTIEVRDAAGGVVFGPITEPLIDGAESNVTVSLPNADDAVFSVRVHASLDGCRAPDACETAVFADVARVDTEAPNAAFAFPADGALLALDDDVDSAPGLQIDVVVQEVAAPTNAHACVLTLDGTALPPCSVTGTSCVARVTLDDGAHTLSAACSDAAGNTAALAEIEFNVDTTAPELSVIGLTTVNTATDESLVDTGVQETYAVTFSGLEPGASIVLVSDIEGVIGAAAVDAASGTVDVRATFIFEGDHIVTAEAIDAAGNTGVSAPLRVSATTGLLFVIVDNPPLRGGVRSITAAEDGDGDSNNGAQVAVRGTTAAPMGATITVLVNGSVRGTPETVDANGAFTVNVTFHDGESGTFEVTVDSGLQQGSSGVDDFVVDL